MAVPTQLSDLSATAASNSPAGSDTVGTTMDDHIRALASIIARIAAGTDKLAPAAITGTAAILGANTFTGLQTMSAGLIVDSQTGPLGYGPGAGGTVTQTTSKDTAVTLNRPCGQIITHNQSLAASTSTAFQFNNTLITEGDLVLISIQNGPASWLTYSVQSAATSTGSCLVIIRNHSAGALAEALTLNFVVLRGSTV